MNKWSCWCDVARDMDACVRYVGKSDSRVGELQPLGVVPTKKKNTNPNPKAIALQWLMEGKTPQEICAKAPDVFFTHHRAIMETYKMLQVCVMQDLLGEEE